MALVASLVSFLSWLLWTIFLYVVLPLVALALLGMAHSHQNLLLSSEVAKKVLEGPQTTTEKKPEVIANQIKSEKKSEIPDGVPELKNFLASGTYSVL